jgi:hypothetical protein
MLVINKKKKSGLTKPLSLDDLANFTEQVLLPAVEEIIDKKIEDSFDRKFDEKFDKGLDKKLDLRFAKQTYELKSYVDSKAQEAKGDIIAFIKGDKERDRQWKMKILEIVERKKLTGQNEIKILTDLIR